MTWLEFIFDTYIRDPINTFFRDVTVISFLVAIIFFVVAFIATKLIYKNHKRIYNKFAVYILNNSWISLILQRMMLSIEFDESIRSISLADDINISSISKLGSKIKYQFALLLRNVTNYLTIAECKNYFRFK